MMPRITPRTIELIKERLPVSAVVAGRVQLKRAGREWRALSPFTAEKTPSFFVNDAKGFYHCFSSGKHGNIFDFVMEMDGLTFPEAVEELAREAGVEVSREGVKHETSEARTARDAAAAALRCAQDFFVEHLHRHRPAQEYLNGRGLRRRIASDLGIGWAPDSAVALLDHLSTKGCSLAAMADAGLVTVPDDPSRGPVAFYRNRITFPIRSRKHHGEEVIAFGARTISGQDPKYLNGRETALFDKGRTLYNLGRARPAIGKAGASIVLEGYIDVATAVQAGFENVVAPLGTALTVEHLHLLWRVAPLVVYVGDGDAAGERACNRTLETALPWISGDRRITFALPPAGVDPDDMIRTSGIEAFRALIRDAQPTVDRLWQWLRTDVPGDQPEDRAKVEAEIAVRLAPVADPAMRRAFTDELMRRARRLGMTPRASLGPPEISRRFVSAIPAREAALVVAAALHPEYVEAELERFAAAEISAPLCASVRNLVVGAIASGSGIPAESIARDLAVLKDALPRPEPNFVTSLNLEGFKAALDLQSSQGPRRRLSAAFGQRASANPAT